MKLFSFLFLLLALISSGCQSRSEIKYMDDSAFLSPTSANSPEAFVSVNNFPCVDVEGIPGLCSIRIKQNQSLKISLSGKPYPYQLSLVCSENVKVNQEFSLPAKEKFSFEISSQNFKSMKSFICIGEIYPQDRPEEVSSKFEIRVKILDENYETGEQIRLEKQSDGYYLNFGKYAKYVHVYDQGKWYFYSKSPSVKVSSPDVFAIAETQTCRYSFFKPIK